MYIQTQCPSSIIYLKNHLCREQNVCRYCTNLSHIKCLHTCGNNHSQIAFVHKPHQDMEICLLQSGSMIIVLPYNYQNAIVYIFGHLAVHVFHSFPTQLDDQGLELHLMSDFWGWFTMNLGNKAWALTFRPLCGCICPHT